LTGSSAQDTGRGADSRRTIIEVATRAFMEHGYSKSTMVDLATRAGTSVGLLYYHFGSKEDLYFAIWSEYQVDQEERVDRALKAARAEGIEDPVELLIASVRAYMEGAWHHRTRYWMVHARDVPPRLVDARRQSGDRWRQRNARALSDDSPMRSRVLNATLVGFLTEVTLEVVRSRDDDEAEALIDDAMSVLRGLFSPRDASPGRSRPNPRRGAAR
jgi:AcrR family transcriptional regulator